MNTQENGLVLYKQSNILYAPNAGIFLYGLF